MKPRGLKWWFSRGLLIAVVLGFTAFLGLRELVREDYEAAGKRLLLLVELRKDALQAFFDTSEAELVFWSESEYFKQSFAEGALMWREFAAMGGDPAAVLRHQYIENNPYPEDERYKLVKAPDDDAETSLHARLHPFISNFTRTRGYDDFFKITPDGYVYYSMQKRDDYATNLRHWPFASTELARVYRASMAQPYGGEVYTSDLAPYPAKKNHRAIFVSRAMVDANDNILGSIAMELPAQRIDDIMQFKAGLGDAGELLLVGADSQPRTALEQGSGTAAMDPAMVERIVAASQDSDQGLLLANDRDDDYIWAWDSMPVGESRWTIIGRADKEAIAAAQFKRHQGIAVILLALYGLAMSTLWLFSAREPEEALAQFDAPESGSGGLDDAV